jgi:Protein of unknown function (DUF4239)
MHQGPIGEFAVSTHSEIKTDQRSKETKGRFVMTLVDYPLWLFGFLLIVLTGVVEVGFRLTLRAAPEVDPERHEQIVGTRNDIAILLSLLLGFTLAMVLSRFDLRKQLVVDEANAIGTTSLRGAMLPEPSRSKVQELLRQYTEARLEFSKSEMNSGTFQMALKRSRQTQIDLWQQSMGVAQQSPTPITALFVQSLNETIDLDAKRLAALENRVPSAIWATLLLLSLLTCLMVGYSQRQRFLPAMLVPPLMIAIVMSLVADLDTPGSGLIRVGQRSIERLHSELDAGSPSQ